MYREVAPHPAPYPGGRDAIDGESVHPWHSRPFFDRDRMRDYLNKAARSAIGRNSFIG